MPTANVVWNGQNYRINFDKKLSDREVFDYMQKNYPVEQPKIEQTQEKKDLKTFVSEDIKPKLSKVGDKALGLARSLTQGYTIGQAPHLAGVTNELANLPKKYESISSIDDIKRFYKDLGKDYIKGREQFKTEYKDFADKNKALAIGGEIIGGLGTGLGSGALKVLANKPVINAIGSGAGLGALYGASNTEGKGLDVKGATIGAGAGALGGAILPSVASLGRRLKVGENLNKLGKWYNQTFDEGVKKSAVLKPVKEVLDEEGKNLTGTVSSYARPSGTQNRTARLFAENPNIRKEALKGDVGLRFEEYGNDAVKSLSKVKDVIRQAENNAYKEAGITDDYVIDLSKSNILDDLLKAQKNYNDEIALFSKSTKADVNLGNDLLNDLKIATLANGNKISFGNLKRITNKLYNDKQKAFKDFGGGSAEYKLLSDFYKTMSGLKYQDKVLAKPTQKFAELTKAIDDLEEATGINLENSKGFASKIFSGARDRADGGVQEQALENFTKVMDKFDDTKALKDISNKIKMAQFSYDVRPTSIDSKFARDVAQGVGKSDTFVGVGKEALKRVALGKNYEPQEFYQLLARRIKAGKVKPEDLTKQFKRIKVAGLDDITSNRLYLQNKLLGNRAGVIGKIIEQFYK